VTDRYFGGDLVVITKTNRHATVHRDSRMDYIGVRQRNEAGRTETEFRLVGLFTSKAYMATASDIPVLRRKLTRILDQQDLLESLRDAAVEAADAMRDSCPRSAPRNPVERLQAMLERLEATLEAVKIVRPALESFYNTLSADQRRRFEALGPKITTAQVQDRSGTENSCGSDKPGLANFPIAKIQEAVSPSDDQLDLLDALEDATFKALDIMKAACPEDPPASPNERLAATQTRLEAMIEAAKAIQPALEDFYAALNDQQKAQFSRMKS